MKWHELLFVTALKSDLLSSDWNQKPLNKGRVSKWWWSEEKATLHSENLNLNLHSNICGLLGKQVCQLIHQSTCVAPQDNRNESSDNICKSQLLTPQFASFYVKQYNQTFLRTVHLYVTCSWSWIYQQWQEKSKCSNDPYSPCLRDCFRIVSCT